MVNVYFNKEIIAKVKYNDNLDIWDGSRWNNGGVGYHLGITKLRNIDMYVLIHGTDWDGGKDYAEIVSDEEALQAILSSNNEKLLQDSKYLRLLELSNTLLDKEVL
jgi:hypothetical protein